MRVTTSQYKTSGKNNAHLLNHNLPAGERAFWHEVSVFPTDPIARQ